ncbi:MAG: 16S rRNA (uracil(1498)-N(3))-methyltransferase [Acidobacteriota bacterium]|nr:16S rRNA (uracil(1498)-N(3))-methyltransferase [Acidobacteriota bacterium]
MDKFYMARRRFFVDEIQQGRARILGDEAHHLTRVLRVERGQKYEISDNHAVWLAEVQDARKDLVSFTLIEPVTPVNPPVRVTVFASLVRFERFEDLIEKATELGVERIIPVVAERSEKGLELAAEKRMARWRRVAREASEQSRRVRLPELCLPQRLSEALKRPAACRLFLDELATHPILAALAGTRSIEDEVLVLVGPEGGWTDRERTAITGAGWCSVSLGPAILKTDTAAMAAIAIVTAAWL